MYDLNHMNEDLSIFSSGSFAASLLAVIPSGRVLRRHVARGDTVFRQDDRVLQMCLLEKGRVALKRTLPDGTSTVLHVAEAGESFAEASLSADNYHCDAIAEADSTVLFVPKTDLLGALAADPCKCLALAAALAAQVRDLRARIELRNIRAAPERVLAWLRLHANGDPPVVPLRRSWTLIADELGLTREAVYRALAALERTGQIERSAQIVRLFGMPRR